MTPPPGQGFRIRPGVFSARPRANISKKAVPIGSPPAFLISLPTRSHHWIGGVHPFGQAEDSFFPSPCEKGEGKERGMKEAGPPFTLFRNPPSYVFSLPVV